MAAAPRPEVHEIGVGKREVFDVAAAHVGNREDQPLGIAIGEGTEEHGVDHAEERDDGAHSERDGGYGRGQ